jgi:membrane fusion protein (multidrug efflux system)
MSGQVMERSAAGIAAREGLSAPPRIRKARLSRKRLGLAGAAFLAGLGLAWYGHEWWMVGRFFQSTDDAYVGGNVTSISPHVAGFVADIAVGDNQHVRAGQLLVRLDPRDYQAALDHAEAVVQERAATLASLDAKSVFQQSMIRQAMADLAAKTARAVFADEDAKRYANLAATSFGSRQDAEKTLAANREAQSAVLSSQAGLEAAGQQLKVLEAEIVEARANVAQARSDLETARLNLGYTEIRAPVDGYVGNRAARTGEYVANGAYLLSVIPAHGLWVDANFKEDQLARMRPGQKAAVIADVLPGTVFHGHLLSLAPGTGAVFSVIPPENATGNFTKIVQRVPVRIALDDGDATLGKLRPGLSTTVSVDTRASAP